MTEVPAAVGRVAPADAAEGGNSPLQLDVMSEPAPDRALFLLLAILALSPPDLAPSRLPDAVASGPSTEPLALRSCRGYAAYSHIATFRPVPFGDPTEVDRRRAATSVPASEAATMSLGRSNMSQNRLPHQARPALAASSFAPLLRKRTGQSSRAVSTRNMLALLSPKSDLRDASRGEGGRARACGKTHVCHKLFCGKF